MDSIKKVPCKFSVSSHIVLTYNNSKINNSIHRVLTVLTVLTPKQCYIRKKILHKKSFLFGIPYITRSTTENSENSENSHAPAIVFTHNWSENFLRTLQLKKRTFFLLLLFSPSIWSENSFP